MIYSQFFHELFTINIVDIIQVFIKLGKMLYFIFSVIFPSINFLIIIIFNESRYVNFICVLFIL
ncbi:hypothetical protein BG74_08835 [Sodalis-like endosymbiont of Proechinophthirus fluctus]|nr:hypothetical protein BG74_08835 [Sodalis-like endosymbiont of Proechinophthirus fluctus]